MICTIAGEKIVACYTLLVPLISNAKPPMCANPPTRGVSGLVCFVSTVA